MNEREKAITRNNNARLFDMQDKMHRNCVRLNCGNTLEHEMAKAEFCYKLLRIEHEFLTEARTPDRKCRADIVDLDEGIIYEITVSESAESVLEKETRYPLPVIRINGV